MRMRSFLQNFRFMALLPFTIVEQLGEKNIKLILFSLQIIFLFFIFFFLLKKTGFLAYYKTSYDTKKVTFFVSALNFVILLALVMLLSFILYPTTNIWLVILDSLVYMITYQLIFLQVFLHFNFHKLMTANLRILRVPLFVVYLFVLLLLVNELDRYLEIFPLIGFSVTVSFCYIRYLLSLLLVNDAEENAFRFNIYIAIFVTRLCFFDLTILAILSNLFFIPFIFVIVDFIKFLIKNFCKYLFSWLDYDAAKWAKKEFTKRTKFAIYYYRFILQCKKYLSFTERNRFTRLLFYFIFMILTINFPWLGFLYLCLTTMVEQSMSDFDRFLNRLRLRRTGIKFVPFFFLDFSGFSVNNSILGKIVGAISRTINPSGIRMPPPNPGNNGGNSGKDNKKNNENDETREKDDNSKAAASFENAEKNDDLALIEESFPSSVPKAVLGSAHTEGNSTTENMTGSNTKIPDEITPGVKSNNGSKDESGSFTQNLLYTTFTGLLTNLLYNKFFDEKGESPETLAAKLKDKTAELKDKKSVHELTKKKLDTAKQEQEFFKKKSFFFFYSDKAKAERDFINSKISYLETKCEIQCRNITALEKDLNTLQSQSSSSSDDTLI